MALEYMFGGLLEDEDAEDTEEKHEEVTDAPNSAA